METTNDIQMPGEENASGRPKFLTVLCILSFVWCGLGFIMGIYGLIQNQPEKQMEQIEKLRDVMPEMADKMEQNLLEMQDSTYMQISPYLNFVFMLISFMGVLMMWKMNKKGFYVYLAGELLPYLGFILSFKLMMSAMSGGGMMPALGPIILGLMVVSDVAFFVMYGANLKHMNGGSENTSV